MHPGFPAKPGDLETATRLDECFFSFSHDSSPLLFTVFRTFLYLNECALD
jgi:hypothetical protein